MARHRRDLSSEQFGGRTYSVGGRQLPIQSIVLRNTDNGKLGVEASIDYHGGPLKHYRGIIFFEGNARFDSTSESVVATDLDYVLDPKRRNPFLRAADRLAHDSVRSGILESARWPIDSQIALLRAEVERGINRPLSAGVLLRGRVDAITPAGIALQPDSIVIRVVATGSAEVEVRQWQ